MGVGARTERRIDEDDYDQLADLTGWIAFRTAPQDVEESR